MQRRILATLLLTCFANGPLAIAQSPAIRDPATICAEVCSSCHGKNLTGGAGPNLLDTYWNHGGDDESILRSLRKGWPESNMPPFGELYSDAELHALVAYLHQQGEEFAAGRITLPPAPADQTVESELHAFRLETVVPNLDTPWGIAFLPDGNMLVTERPGRLRIVVKGQLQPEPIAGTPDVFLHQDGGLLDVIAHPDYAKNGWIYLAYSEGGPNGTSATVVVRGRIRDGRWTDQEIIFKAPPEHHHTSFIHYGCRFLFDRENHLFFTIGDRGESAEAQDLSSPCGKIHRVLDDGRIPPDNPFANRPGALGSIWCYGNRHPQGLMFHPVTGRLWESEHGPTNGDEINRIEPGHNYGWPVISNGTDRRAKIEGTSRAGMEPPIVFWTPSIAPSAIEFYTGDRFPRWKNHLFVTGLGGEQLRRLETDGDRVVHQEILFKGLGRVRDVTTGPDGYLYVAFNGPGRIARLVPTSPAGATEGERKAAALPKTDPPAVQRSLFGVTADDQRIESFTLTNRHGLEARVITYGAILAELRVPDRDGHFESVVREAIASQDNFQRRMPNAAAVYGRVANRIGNARFTLDGREYRLTANAGPNHIHGDEADFSRAIWTPLPAEASGVASVALSHVSPDGAGGYPGRVEVTVRYTLTEEDALRIDYTATTDKPTPINLTNHAFFNLGGSGEVADHVLTLNADAYTVVDDESIPTGEIRSVAGTPFDFRQPAALGARVAQLGEARRYNHNLVIQRPPGDAALRFTARVLDPHSGRQMEVWTTEPGVQLFTSALAPRAEPSRRGFDFYCFETQHFPDSVNHPKFPSTILRPGQTFRSTTEFRFSVSRN
jgi:glucose/arabinose dehydrogenase/galactose mutarotase-like enzyme